jgi:hypothetical protein
MKPTLLSVKEIAQEMGVSTQSIRRAYWKGDIPAFRVCKMLRFDLERVRDIFLAKGLPADRATQAERDRRRQPAARPAQSPRTVRRGLV